MHDTFADCEDPNCAAVIVCVAAPLLTGDTANPLNVHIYVGDTMPLTFAVKTILGFAPVPESNTPSVEVKAKAEDSVIKTEGPVAPVIPALFLAKVNTLETGAR